MRASVSGGMSFLSAYRFERGRRREKYKNRIEPLRPWMPPGRSSAHFRAMGFRPQPGDERNRQPGADRHDHQRQGIIAPRLFGQVGLIDRIDRSEQVAEL